MKASRIVLALAGGLALLGATAAAAPAEAHWDGWRRHEWREHQWRREQAWRQHQWRERHWREPARHPGYVYAPRPNYAPPYYVR